MMLVCVVVFFVLAKGAYAAKPLKDDTLYGKQFILIGGSHFVSKAPESKQYSSLLMFAETIAKGMTAELVNKYGLKGQAYITNGNNRKDFDAWLRALVADTPIERVLLVNTVIAAPDLEILLYVFEVEKEEPGIRKKLIWTKSVNISAKELETKPAWKIAVDTGEQLLEQLVKDGLLRTEILETK